VDHPPRGLMVDVGGRKMHIDCRGSGSPTVLLEAGLDINGAAAWTTVHDELARTTRVCAYDRAGIMWSDPKPGPHDGDGAADDLHRTLAGAGISGPIVLVGHSLGGPLAMSFVRKYGGDVAGLVFVDTSHPDQLERFKAAGMDASPTKDPTLKIGDWLSWTGVLRLFVDQPYPHATPDAIGAMRAYSGRSVHAARMEAEALPTILQQGGELRTLGDRPLVVLTANKPWPHEALAKLQLTRPQADAIQKMWIGLMADEASWSSRSRQEVVADSGHYIQHDRPDLVVKAVNEVVAAVRAEAGASAAKGAGDAA
jgi:pimeloyl-ACP methyl ester carboxylesterase